MKRRFTLLLFTLLSLSFILNAQPYQPKAEDFTAAGDAVRTGNNCFQLTTASDWSGGSLWFKTPVDLSAPFEMEVKIMLGCKDGDGADGLVFVFHPKPRFTGNLGEGMGFGGLVPSLGIEIDTWQNFHLLDPPEDHLALMANGRLRHQNSLAGPVRIKNVEDCRLHDLKVSWSPNSKSLKVALDGKEYISYRGNIVKDIFYSRSEVYWGVTAATGKYNNRQEICFEKLSYMPSLKNLAFDRLTAKSLLAGNTRALDNMNFKSGQSDLETQSYPELQKLYKLLEENPEMNINIYGHTDNTGDNNSNKRLSERRAKAVEEFLISKGIDRDRIRSKGFGEDFPIASNSSPGGRSKNRRVEVYLFRHIP